MWLVWRVVCVGRVVEWCTYVGRVVSGVCGEGGEWCMWGGWLCGLYGEWCVWGGWLSGVRMWGGW